MIEVRHSIPGRLRLGIPALRRNPALADDIQAALAGVDGLLRVSTNLTCGSLTVCWWHQLQRRERIEAALLPVLHETIPDTTRRWLRWRAAVEPTPESVACDACGQATATRARRERRRPRLLSIIGFVALTGYLGFVLFREYVLKRPVPAGAFSVTGLVALAAAIPLLRDAWHETVVERRFTIHQFLAFSLLLAIGFGEALTAFEIIYVLRGGDLLERYVGDRSRRAIRNMLALSVKDAWVLKDGAEIQVPVAELRQGDVVVIRTGEKVPVDGRIAQGEAELSEAVITGRAEPVHKEMGASVYAGSYLEQGWIQVRAESVGEHTYLARIAALVDASLDRKAPLEQRADVLAARLLKLGALMTVGTLVLTQSITRAFTVMLVMSCPCSTILAASTAVSAAVHSAARRQMLVKGGVYLEQLSQADLWCFDKTGTLTTEEPEVAEIVALDPRDLLFWAASAELHNSHALAHAITRHAASLGIEPLQHSGSEHILGHGVRATVDGREVLVGNRRLLAEAGIVMPRLDKAAERLHANGLTAVYVAADNKVLGLIGVRHRLRADARATIARLRADGVRQIVLISGDERAVAEGLARELGLDGCHAELLPEDKARLVAELRANGRSGIVMIGDGVNDALALSDADVGIAMGAGGSEVAIEVADIALADSDMRKLAALRELSRATLRTADQNYYLAIGTDLIGIVFGALGLLSPAAGGMIHIVHTVGILANSSRLLAYGGRDAAAGRDRGLVRRESAVSSDARAAADIG